MRIGYPCINLTLPCRGNRTFRLKSYSESRLVETLENNLNCLSQILRYNVEHSILFFRITSDLVPFASHPVCQLNWQNQFRKALKEIGRFINRHKVRISMHPDQFTLINTPDRRVLERSRRELLYHVQVLDLMEVDYQAKVQIHVGGVYGDKAKSVSRFIHRFEMLDAPIQKSDSLHSCPLGHSLLPLIRSTCAPDMVILVNVSILAITSVRYIIARKTVEGKRPIGQEAARAFHSFLVPISPGHPRLEFLCLSQKIQKRFEHRPVPGASVRNVVLECIFTLLRIATLTTVSRTPPLS